MGYHSLLTSLSGAVVQNSEDLDLHTFLISPRCGRYHCNLRTVSLSLLVLPSSLPLPTDLLLSLLHPHLTPSSPESQGFYHKCQEALAGYFCLGLCTNLYQGWGEDDVQCA